MQYYAGEYDLLKHVPGKTYSFILQGLKNLTFLNLNDNRLTSLPSEINQLPHLQVLSLDKNSLQEVYLNILGYCRVNLRKVLSPQQRLGVFHAQPS